MSLKQSKFAKEKAKPNPWKEIPIHESNLIDALSYSLKFSGHLKSSEEVERVLVGEPVNGVYPLSVAIIKKGDK